MSRMSALAAWTLSLAAASPSLLAYTTPIDGLVGGVLVGYQRVQYFSQFDTSENALTGIEHIDHEWARDSEVGAFIGHDWWLDDHVIVGLSLEGLFSHAEKKVSDADADDVFDVQIRDQAQLSSRMGYRFSWGTPYFTANLSQLRLRLRTYDGDTPQWGAKNFRTFGAGVGAGMLWSIDKVDVRLEALQHRYGPGYMIHRNAYLTPDQDPGDFAEVTSHQTMRLYIGYRF